MKRFCWLGFVLFFYLICTGCGDTFRPIIIPNPPVFPNPQAAHTVVSINYNEGCSQKLNPCPSFVPVPGSAMVVDVSGDTDVSTVNTGIAPVHAVQQTANQVLVVNQSVTGMPPPLDGGCLITQTPPNPVLNVCPSITKLTFNGTVISSTATITLPPSSAANFVATTESGQAYVSLPNYIPNPTPPFVVVPSVEVVNTTSNNLVTTIPVGNNAIAMAETPDGKKLYVANEGDSTISGFNTLGFSQRVGSPTVTSSASIWLSARSDSQMVYVLEKDGTLASLNTVSTAGPDTFTEYPGLAVPSAAIMTYDPNLNRLYIAGGQEMEMVDVSQSPPALITTIAIPPFPLLNLASVTATATSAAALPDGSRVYVGSYATLPSELTISSISGDGTNATYAYTLTAGHDLNPGATVTIANLPNADADFEGQFIVGAIVTGTSACPGTCFQVPNTTVLASTSVSASGTGSNIFPQVTVVNETSNTTKTTAAVPGFPDATIVGSPYYVPACANPANTRFRFMMATGGDSTRAYLSSCDGGVVDIIDTSSDTYGLNLPAPVGSSPPIPPSLQNPPQNPVFLLAGP